LGNLNEELGRHQRSNTADGQDATVENDDCPEGFDRSDSDGDTAEELTQEEIDRVNLARRRILYDSYSRITQGLYSSGRIRFIDVPEEIFELDNFNNPNQDAAQAYNRVNWTGSTADDPTDIFGNPHGGLFAGIETEQSLIADFQSNMFDEITDDDTDNNIGEGMQEDLEDPQELGAWNINEPNRRRIFYFYLGDLIDIVLKDLRLPSNPGHKSMEEVRLILGTILIGIPEFRRDITTPGGRLGATGEVGRGSRIDRMLINIADIPISLHLFLQFFTEKVISRMRSVWPFKTFLKEIFSSIIRPAVGRSCAASRNLTRAPNVVISHISAYADDEGNDRMIPTQSPGSPRDDSFGGRRIYERDIRVLDSTARLQDRRMFNYMLVQADQFISPGRMATLPDSPEFDAAEGIYWLNIGNDRGLVREIKFKKSEVAGMQEARQEREGTIGLGQMRDKYDADITLFGNNLFQPGQILYLNPTTMGLGTPLASTKLSSILGVGGYYQVIDVDGIISDKGYETVLNALWVASGAGLSGRDDPCEDDPCADLDPNAADTNIVWDTYRTQQEENRLRRAARAEDDRVVHMMDPEERAAENRRRREAGLNLPSTYRGENLRDMDYDDRQTAMADIRRRRREGLPDLL